MWSQRLVLDMRRVVAAARALIMSDAHDARTVGEPLPVNPEAVRAALDGVAADAARFRRRRTPGDADFDVDGGRRQEGQEPPLNWGPEGEEGPLLSIGGPSAVRQPWIRANPNQT